VMGLRPQPILDVIERSTQPFIARATLNSKSELGRVKVKVRPPPAVDLPQLKMQAPRPTLGALP
jgi:hypothetical protein